MQEWCLAHPYMTLMIVICIVGLVDDIFEYITGYHRPEKEDKKRDKEE